MDKIVYLYILVIILIIANIGIGSGSREQFTTTIPSTLSETKFYTNNKLPWNIINENVSQLEQLVADISNSIPYQFKLGHVLQKIITNPSNINSQNIVPSTANCSLVESFYNWSMTNDTTANISHQMPIVTVDGSVPSNILLNFTFPPPVAGAVGSIGPTGAVGPEGAPGPAGPMGVQGYWL